MIIVITEWKVLREAVDPLREPSAEDHIEGDKLLQALYQIRNDVSIFIYTEMTDPSIVRSELIDGYFFKEDDEIERVAGKILTETIVSRVRAPFADALLDYTSTMKDSFHTPGHSNGDSLKKSQWVKYFYDAFGPTSFQADLSCSVLRLDSLLDPKGLIKEAQESAAQAFGARYSFFVTNGSSTANKIVLQTLVRPSDHVLISQNCHKSLHYAIQMSGGIPIYLRPSFNARYGLYGPVPKATIVSALRAAREQGIHPRMLVLTNCSYDGLTYDLKSIIELAHEHELKVHVDEAWYGHARFHPAFPISALEAGADYVTQSPHKTLSAFSQASFVHVNDPEFDEVEDIFLEVYKMHTSTSPNYPIIASLDIARKQMALEGYYLLDLTLKFTQQFRDSLKTLKRFRVLELADIISPELAGDQIGMDITKVTIDISGSGLSNRDVEHLLISQHSIQIEKSTFATVTILVTIGSNTSKMNRLFFALQQIEKTFCPPTRKVKQTSDNFTPVLSIAPLLFRPRDAFYCKGERIPVAKSANRIAILQVVPYPPGIPLLVPGNLITPQIVSIMIECHENEIELHGIREGMISVLTADEAALLTSQGLNTSEAFQRLFREPSSSPSSFPSSSSSDPQSSSS